MYALHNLGIGTTTLFINFIPVVTAFVSAWLLREKPSWGQAAGGGLVILAVTMVSLQKFRRK
jgi:drug/metabolite transporter (DMT)-like permease